LHGRRLSHRSGSDGRPPGSCRRGCGGAWPPLKARRSSADTDNHRALPGGSALAGGRSRAIIVAELIALGGAALLAGLVADFANWDLVLFGTLMVFSAVSDLRAIETGASVKVSGSFLALVLAMVFLGGTPAALLGVSTMVLGWLRWRDTLTNFLINIVTYAWFPLVGGIGFRAVIDATGLTSDDGFFYVFVLCVFAAALALNFLMIAFHTRIVEGPTILSQFKKAVVPVASSEVAAATLAVGVALLYSTVGIAAVILFGVILFAFQHLLGQLLVSEERAEELERRTRQLASLQVGLLSALLHTLDLRDRMTARHSAAVARYSKEIARAAGFSEDEQDLVHTAALLHDVGKFIFPDRILKGDQKLTDEDWNTIRMHPYQGARIVSQIEGYGPVGEIIIAHHERFDGKGYPRRLRGNQIPALARIISVSDIYDVMTARDSYRKPVSSFEAIRELRRVAGTQLDPDLVEVFIQVLAGKDVRYRHGEDADFDAELALEKRVHDYAAIDRPGATVGSSEDAAAEKDEQDEFAALGEEQAGGDLLESDSSSGPRAPSSKPVARTPASTGATENGG
jgi:putative nucleotidyltransferase with HDIG domain